MSRTDTPKVKDTAGLGRVLMRTTAIVSLVTLTACMGPRTSAVNDEGQPDLKTTLQQAAVQSELDQNYVAAAAYWGTLYDRDPDSLEAAVNYSRSLRRIGSTDEAHSVLGRAMARHGDDAGLLAEYGKVLAQTGRAEKAVPILDKAASLAPADWTIKSAAGVALDHMGDHVNAQKRYAEALQLSPKNTSILNNMGLSYALAGDLDQAEVVLRRAVAQTESTAQMRQNLAIVVGLKGDLTEAERLARADLPPRVADQNMQYLREVLSQPARWKQIDSAPAGTPAGVPADPINDPAQ